MKAVVHLACILVHLPRQLLCVHRPEAAAKVVPILVRSQLCLTHYRSPDAPPARQRQESNLELWELQDRAEECAPVDHKDPNVRQRERRAVQLQPRVLKNNVVAPHATLVQDAPSPQRGPTLHNVPAIRAKAANAHGTCVSAVDSSRGAQRRASDLNPHTVTWSHTWCMQELAVQNSHVVGWCEL